MYWTSTWHYMLLVLVMNCESCKTFKWILLKMFHCFIVIRTDYLMNRSTVKPYQCPALHPGYFFHPGWQSIHSLTLCFIVKCLLFFLYSQYTRHKSFVGGHIDVTVLEMWEESLDGSGKSAICLDCSKWCRGRCAPWGHRKGAPHDDMQPRFHLSPWAPRVNVTLWLTPRWSCEHGSSWHQQIGINIYFFFPSLLMGIIFHVVIVLWRGKMWHEAFFHSPFQYYLCQKNEFHALVPRI